MTDRPDPRGSVCPRCDSPISGAFKFCPTCAFRLRSSASEAGRDGAAGSDGAPDALARPSRSLASLVGAVLAALVVAALGGAAVLLLRPRVFARPAAAPAVRAPVAHERVLARPYTVADIPTQLVRLERGGFAYSVLLDDVPNVSPAEAARIRERLRADGSEYGETASLDAVVHQPLRILRTEVTVGQYEEFLRDVEAERTHAPTAWAREDGVASPAAVDLWKHVPPEWVRRRDGAPATFAPDEPSKNLPITRVSYLDALAFCEWASRRLDLSIGLPNAVEWIRAARPYGAGRDTTSLWPWGGVKLLYACNSLTYWLPNAGRAQIVDFPYSEGDRGSTNGGILAMAGNVREWAGEHLLVLVPPVLGEVPTLAAKALPDSTTAFACGGSFRTAIDDCQIDSRTTFRVTERRDDVGFRIVVR